LSKRVDLERTCLENVWPKGGQDKLFTCLKILNMAKPHKIKAKGYYVLLCHCGAGGYWDVVVCGVYASRKEAMEGEVMLGKCLAKHTINKCDIEIKI
jgi:hypothetical protein